MSTAALQPAARRPAPPAPAALLAAQPAAVSDADFAKFQALINREAGIWLSPVKKALLVGRLSRRLRELGVASWRGYHELVLADGAERVRMLDAITTNETHFFREPRHWEHLAAEVLPAWLAEAQAGRRPRRLRAWSAACSTGEEPYSLAMLLRAALPEGWDLEILATDLSTRVLDRARLGVWPLDKARELPEAYLKAFMLRGVGPQEGLMKAGPEIRQLVKFSRLNLAEAALPPIGRFDLIFCRNVLIYFDRNTKERVVDRLLDLLAPGGLLLLGHAESLTGCTSRARPVQPTIYARTGPAGGEG